MRDALYAGLTHAFHETEMAIYHKATDKACVLAFLEDGEMPIRLMALSLQNVVDGCLSSPVGYLEGTYREPARRGKGDCPRDAVLRNGLGEGTGLHRACH
jgi:hypothetical protein